MTKSRSRTWLDRAGDADTLFGLPSLISRIIKWGAVAALLVLGVLILLVQIYWLVMPALILMFLIWLFRSQPQRQPTPEPDMPTPVIRRAPPAPSPTSRSASLRAALQQELDRGVEIRDRLPNRMAGGLKTVRTLAMQGRSVASEAEVGAWIAGVEALLIAEPRALSDFRLHEPQPGSIALWAITDPVVLRMDDKLGKLEGIIKRL